MVIRVSVDGFLRPAVGHVAIRDGGGDNSGCGIASVLTWSVVAVPLSTLTAVITKPEMPLAA